MKCHICDEDLVTPRTDPFNNKKLLPCDNCLDEIQDCIDTYKKSDDEAEPFCEHEIILDQDFDIAE